MSLMLAILVSLHAQAAAPAAPSPERRWLSCDTLETPEGRVIVDRWAFVAFDTGSARISGQGAANLDGFVTNYDAPSHCRVMVTAHADRMGSPERNLRLSRRRAAAVAAYLRRKGLSAPIAIEPLGEASPMVDTPDGVAEPQNRFVQVWVDDPMSR
jgi:outer membrane protein OmpA-like peptidoglycan-associated protein